MQYAQGVTAGQGQTIKAFAHLWRWSHLSQSATPLDCLLEQWPLLGLLGTGEWFHSKWGNPWVYQFACGETIAPPRGLHWPLCSATPVPFYRSVVKLGVTEGAPVGDFSGISKGSTWGD